VNLDRVEAVLTAMSVAKILATELMLFEIGRLLVIAVGSSVNKAGLLRSACKGLRT